jgi:very-short-patch-repair endonuclease
MSQDNFIKSYYRAMGGPFTKPDCEIPDYRKAIIHCFQEGCIDDLLLSLNSVLDQMGSPIEEMIAGALILLTLGNAEEVRVRPEYESFQLGDGPDILTIWPQKQIGDYRVDFYIEKLSLVNEQVLKVIVECDGHNFHERTKEQAQKDKERDRVLQSCGYPVFRFTGSEIWANPFKCAKNVLDFLDAK